MIHVAQSMIQMWNTKQLASAAVLVAGICDFSVSTTHSLNQTPLALPIRRTLPAIPNRSARRTVRQRSSTTTLSVLNDDNKQERDEWLSVASKIRQEVSELEAAAALSRQGKINEVSPKKSVVDYTDVANSVWILSYRFANDPEESNEKNRDDSLMTQRRLFGGKVTVRFRQDGYTDIVSQESYGSTIESCNIIKAWGWDVELSKDDENDGDMKDQEYILFSMDVEFPTATSGSASITTERFYFQARKDADARTGIISLSDGSVTVKRDIVQKSARWGFFSPAGILAQFRYVGGFVAKPIQITEVDRNVK